MQFSLDSNRDIMLALDTRLPHHWLNSVYNLQCTYDSYLYLSIRTLILVLIQNTSDNFYEF